MRTDGTEELTVTTQTNKGKDFPMKYQQIRKLQKEHGLSELQSMIDSGAAWLMEGSIGREASRMLDAGACMLPKVPHRDYYGNMIPARVMLKPGTKGTFQNSVNYWKENA